MKSKGDKIKWIRGIVALLLVAAGVFLPEATVA